MKPGDKQFGKHVSVPSGKGERVDQEITINAPVSEVYSFWVNLENLARFMPNVASVTITGPQRSHWRVKSAGKTVEWDAEIIEQRENEMISWRSLPGAELDNAGSVWFERAPDGRGTVVRVEMKYDPPAGKLGAAIAKFFGADADADVEESLSRLKQLLERTTTGEEQRKAA
jgi:uncharacterized membrane protein